MAPKSFTERECGAGFAGFWMMESGDVAKWDWAKKVGPTVIRMRMRKWFDGKGLIILFFLLRFLLLGIFTSRIGLAFVLQRDLTHYANELQCVIYLLNIMITIVP